MAVTGPVPCGPATQRNQDQRRRATPHVTAVTCVAGHHGKPPAGALASPPGGGLVDKVMSTADAAVAGIHEGASIAVGGFGLCGIPSLLTAALRARGTGGLRVVSNN